MMFAYLLALAQAAASAAATIDGLPIGALPQQALPARGCAAYLFSTGATRTLAAMATADPATLRLTIEGRPIDLPRTGATGSAMLGLNAETVYRTGDMVATVQMTIEMRQNLTAGAAVPSATLRLDREGRDTVVVPLAGLVGCAG
ncbi:hypothetical protein ASE95_01935 [Sphingomonas sp. Leaf231]|uniref:hypothetical protein n=1 Tax=Sphingomonas sp. Leaf231 TaxID=1736301 RepID=UPI0006FE42D9|nr:hypothetical protein [Sphingomonas sp. Leaf231]KQN93714.1 hypothetical protein ASE95_01935 [Sphingomonas sp. Leaf231]